MKKFIYLDHAAATSPYPEVVALANEVLGKDLGNPSSVHQKGKEARFLIDEARINVATYFGVEGKDVTFTSGATEALHLGIIGGYLGIESPKKKILFSPIAHSCVQGAVNFLEKHFGVERIDIPLLKNGHFDFDRIDTDLLESVDIVVVEHGNSEIGILQNVKKLGEYIQRGNEKPLFVVDVAASIVSCPGVFDLLTTDWAPDMIALSGEKFGGLSGSGALIRREGVVIEPLVSGSHEFGLRGGTENVLGIAAFAKALSLQFENKDALRDHLHMLHVKAGIFLDEMFSDIKMIEGDMFVGHIFCVLLPEGKQADLIVTQCDQKKLCIASGSACSSGTVGGNKALRVLGYSDSEVTRSLRLSFGRDTQLDEVRSAFHILKSLLSE